MIRGGWSGTGARGGGRRIRARIAGGGATLRCTGLLALALVAIVETNVRSDTLCDGTVDHLAVRAVLSDVAGLEAPVAAQDECRVCRLDLGSSLRICVGMQESSVHIVVCYVPLGDELAAEGIVGRQTRNLGKTEEFSDELQAGEVGGSDTLNPTTDTIAAPEIVDIRLVRPLAMAKKVHPCLVAQASILLNMKSLNSLPKLPHAPALMLVNKLEMQLIRGASDDTHGDLLRLTPASDPTPVAGRGGIGDPTACACCAHEDADGRVGGGVRPAAGR